MKVNGDKNTLIAADILPGAYDWYALAARTLDGRISWLPRGDFGCLRALVRLSGQWELGSSSSRKTVWWDLPLASLMHLFRALAAAWKSWTISCCVRMLITNAANIIRVIVVSSSNCSSILWYEESVLSEGLVKQVLPM